MLEYQRFFREFLFHQLDILHTIHFDLQFSTNEIMQIKVSDVPLVIEQWTFSSATRQQYSFITLNLLILVSRI